MGAVADGLQDQREHAGLGVVDDVVDVVGRGGDQLLPRRDREVEAEAQSGAQQRGEDRARVGDQRDRTDRQVLALDVAEGAQPAAYVPEPHAARADDRQARRPGDRAKLLADPLTVGAAEDHRAAGPDLRGRGQLLDERGRRRRRAGPGRAPRPGPGGRAGTGARRPRRTTGSPARPARTPASEAPRRPSARRGCPGAGWRRRTRPCAPRAWREVRPPGFVTGLDGPPQPARLLSRCQRDLRSAMAALAACHPGMPQTPPPPWVAELAL